MRCRTTFSSDQLARLEQAYQQEPYVTPSRRIALATELGLPEDTIKVWYQNRRMKDKRDRQSVAFPYAAVCADPAYAASIVQAAVRAVHMPYGYATMLPQMPQMHAHLPVSRRLPPMHGMPPGAGYNRYAYAPQYGRAPLGAPPHQTQQQQTYPADAKMTATRYALLANAQTLQYPVESVGATKSARSGAIGSAAHEPELFRPYLM